MNWFLVLIYKLFTKSLSEEEFCGMYKCDESTFDGVGHHWMDDNYSKKFCPGDVE
jgi:hypothetical protein